MLGGFVVNQAYLGQPFIGTRRNQMGKWLLPRDDKETRTCDSCGTYKMSAIFYDWFHHPSLTFIDNCRIGIICTPCAKREAGSSNWNRVNGRG